MGIHAVAQCGEKTYFLQGAPDVRFNELGEHEARPIGPIWEGGEPPAIFAQPMFCVDNTAIAVMMRGGSPAPLGHFSINVVRISLSTGQPTYIDATAMGRSLTSADLADARVQIPQLRELLSAGEDATDFVLVNPALLT